MPLLNGNRGAVHVPGRRPMTKQAAYTSGSPPKPCAKTMSGYGAPRGSGARPASASAERGRPWRGTGSWRQRARRDLLAVAVRGRGSAGVDEGLGHHAHRMARVGWTSARGTGSSFGSGRTDGSPDHRGDDRDRDQGGARAWHHGVEPQPWEILSSGYERSIIP